MINKLGPLLEGPLFTLLPFEQNNKGSKKLPFTLLYIAKPIYRPMAPTQLIAYRRWRNRK
jgi:hypothetical protein